MYITNVNINYRFSLYIIYSLICVMSYNTSDLVIGASQGNRPAPTVFLFINKKTVYELRIKANELRITAYEIRMRSA